MGDRAGAAAYWDAAYAQGDGTRSWFQKHPDMHARIASVHGLTGFTG